VAPITTREPWEVVLNRFERRVREQPVAVLRMATMELAENVVRGGLYSPGTPVDKGRARGGWYASLNQAGARRDAGGRFAKTVGVLDKSGRATLGAIARVIERMRLGDRALLLNPVPYIRRLDRGWSDQAPTGFVRLAMAGWPAMVREASKRLGNTRSA
jgi:hypothetical protein